MRQKKIIYITKYFLSFFLLYPAYVILLGRDSRNAKENAWNKRYLIARNYFQQNLSLQVHKTKVLLDKRWTREANPWLPGCIKEYRMSPRQFFTLRTWSFRMRFRLIFKHFCLLFYDYFLFCNRYTAFLGYTVLSHSINARERFSFSNNWCFGQVRISKAWKFVYICLSF